MLSLLTGWYAMQMHWIEQVKAITQAFNFKVGVHLQFHMLQETLFSTVAILDRF